MLGAFFMLTPLLNVCHPALISWQSFAVAEMLINLPHLFGNFAHFLPPNWGNNGDKMGQ
jgi:hypothetical protein